MTAVAKFVTDAKDLIEKVFLKTSFLIVLVSLFLFSQWVDNPIKYLPFIEHFHPKDTEKTPNHYTTYTVTLAMLLLLSRTASFLWDFFDKRFNISELYDKKKKEWKENIEEEAQKRRKLDDEQKKKNDDRIKELHNRSHQCQAILSQPSLISAMIKNDAYAYITAIESGTMLIPRIGIFHNTGSIKATCYMHRVIHFTTQDDKLLVKFGELTINTIQLSHHIPLTATEEGVVDIYNILHAYKDRKQALTFAQL